MGLKVPLTLIVLPLAIFFYFYKNNRGIITKEEASNYLKRIEELGCKSESDDIFYGKELMKNDNGEEFFMINLMQHRKVAKYPSNYDAVCIRLI